MTLIILFYHKFLKKYRQIWKNVILSFYFIFDFQGGGIINQLLDLFFILFIIQFFISLYAIYTFIEIKIFHHQQGSKLKIKQEL